MRSENAQGDTVSVSACTRQETMPNAWRGSRQRSSFRETQRQLPSRPLHGRGQGTAPAASIVDPRCAENGEITGLKTLHGVDARVCCPPLPP